MKNKATKRQSANREDVSTVTANCTNNGRELKQAIVDRKAASNIPEKKRKLDRNVINDAESDSESGAEAPAANRPSSSRQPGMKQSLKSNVVARPNSCPTQPLRNKGDTVGSRKKGPPAKGLSEHRHRSHSSSESDSDYIPDDSSLWSSAESDSDVSVTEVSEPEIFDNNESGEWNLPVKPKVILEYSGDDGISDSVPDSTHEPIDFYNLFIDNEILELMVRETNRNAAQASGQNSQSTHSRVGL